MCLDIPVQSSQYRVLSYQNARFESPNLVNVELIIDSVVYLLGTYTNPNIMRNAFVSQLVALGHINTNPGAALSDVVQVSVDSNGIDYSIIFLCTQGFQTRLQLKIDGVQLVPTVPDIGIFVEYMSLEDGLPYTSVSSFDMAFDSTPQVLGVDSNYGFVSDLLGTYFDNDNATSSNYEFEGNSSGFVINFSANHTDILQVQTAANNALAAINTDNGHPPAKTPYLAALSTTDIAYEPFLTLYCVEELQVTNQAVIIPVFYNSTRKTGFAGNLAVILVDFVQLGLVGNEPQVELTYLLNGRAKAQIFQYDGLDLSYKPI